MNKVQIGSRMVGDGEPVFYIAEIGINHNGDVDIAKKLIQAACLAGADCVKFQKRTVDVVYTADELKRLRDNPFGQTNGDLKYGLEFESAEYNQVDEYCKQHDVLWTASCWDEGSVDFVEDYDPPFYKIASASLTDSSLLRHHRATGRPIILSTGMSSVQEIDRAVDVLGPQDLIILHTTSTYPSKVDELNLQVIPWLAERYQVPVGYSGHETGLATTCAAVALGASVVERHLTLDRAMWGSDQAASIEPHGFMKLVKDCNAVKTSLGTGEKIVFESEVPVRDKLRRVAA